VIRCYDRNFQLPSHQGQAFTNLPQTEQAARISQVRDCGSYEPDIIKSILLAPYAKRKGL